MNASLGIKALMSSALRRRAQPDRRVGKIAPSDARILGRLMWPLASALVLLVIVVSAVLGYQQEQRLRDAVAQRMADIPDRMQAIQAQQLAVMGTLIERIASDSALHEALRNRDHERLLESFGDLQKELRRKYGISHFYFHDKDRYNILRVQFPDKRGGRIERYTMLEAERTGKAAGGLEIGSFGLLTLRVVQPVFAQGTLIGYVELGKEIEDILADLHQPVGVEVAVAIHKEMLKREAWESGMKLVGREFDWDEFPNDVLSYASLWPMPTGMLNQYLAEHDSTQLNLEERAGGRTWRAAAVAVRDASGRSVGHLLVVLDISAQQAAFRKIVMTAAAVSAALLALLLAFLLGLLKKTDAHFIAQQAALHKTQVELQAIFDTVVDGIVVADERGRIELVNPAFLKIFGYRPDEVQGRNISMLMAGPDRCAHDRYMQNYHASGVRKIIGIGREVQGQRKDGSLFPMDIAVNEALIDDRRLYVGLLRDISTRKQAEKALADSRRLQRKYQEHASVDALTGLHNRRWLDEAFARQIARCSKEGRGAILIMLDVDHFKHYNDAHGHVGGDCALRALGKTLSDRIRPNELAARYGGEEFAVLLPDANLGQAFAVAERLRTAVENMPILDTDGVRLPSITISLGLAKLNKGDTLETLVKSADAALYRAKLAGRNFVSI